MIIKHRSISAADMKEMDKQQETRSVHKHFQPINIQAIFHLKLV